MALDDQTYNLERVRQDMEDRWRSNQSAHWYLGAGMAVLTAALAVFAWVSYSSFAQDGQAVAGLPQLHQTVDEISQQMTATKDQVAGLTGQQDQYHAEAQKGLAGMRQQIASAAKHAQEATAEIIGKAREEFQSQINGLSGRVNAVEGSQKQTEQQVAALQGELTEARNQIAAQQQALTAMRTDLGNQTQQNASRMADANRQIVALKDRQSEDRSDFDAFSNKVARQRVDFEVTKHQPHEIIPGISIGVNSTNVSYQKVNGWISAPDKRTIWLRDHPVQEPVVLYSSKDGQVHELVLTRVSKNSVLGYLVVPGGSKPAPTVASAGE